MSFWRRDQVRAARFQSSAAFRTGRTLAAHCGTAVRIQWWLQSQVALGRTEEPEVQRGQGSTALFSLSTPTQKITHGPNPDPTQENSGVSTIRHPALWCSTGFQAYIPTWAKQQCKISPFLTNSFVRTQKCCLNDVFISFHFLIHLTFWKRKCY